MKTIREIISGLSDEWSVIGSTTSTVGMNQIQIRNNKINKSAFFNYMGIDDILDDTVAIVVDGEIDFVSHQMLNELNKREDLVKISLTYKGWKSTRYDVGANSLDVALVAKEMFNNLKHDI